MRRLICTDTQIPLYVIIIVVIKDLHQQQHTWECNKRQSEEANKSQMWKSPSFSSFVPRRPSLQASLIPKTTDVSALLRPHPIAHVVNGVKSLGALHSKPKIQLEICGEVKENANDGTQTQNSFGYIFDALLLWIGDSHFIISYRACLQGGHIFDFLASIMWMRASFCM